MNKGSYVQNQQILMRRLVKRHTVPIYKALQYQMQQVSDYIRRMNTVQPPHFNIDILNVHIAGALINLYEDAAKGARRNYRCVKRFGGGDDFINRVINYLKVHLLDKVVAAISNTTIDIINNVIQQAITEGWGVEKTAKYLETAPITKVRARMIVRTESTKATNLAQMTAADDEVYQIEKTWIAIEDNRTRVSHSHRGVDGEKVNLDQPFTNGLQFPGDPSGSAEEVINCRCTMGYNVARGADGRPIKKNIQSALPQE